ncbi:hypothetical protein GCM10010149_47860 [Nonomuraea roseoviolacea subsp. roseoviolacea]
MSVTPVAIEIPEWLQNLIKDAETRGYDKGFEEGERFGLDRARTAIERLS